MRLEIKDKDVIELLYILGDTYNELSLQLHLQRQGVRQAHFPHIEETKQLLFNTAKLMVTVNKQVHAAGICDCQNDDKIRLMEKAFNQTFKEDIRTEDFLEHIEAHGGFRVASPQSQTSYQPTAKDESTWRPELDKQPESVEAQGKKRQRKP